MYNLHQGRIQHAPVGLASYRQFISWFTVPLPNNKTDKIPCDLYGNTIDAHDPTKWMSWEVVCTGRFPVGFVLTDADDIACIDIDDAYDMATGQWSTLALDVMAMFPDAYVEVSHSGTGLHIMFMGASTLPRDHGIKRKGLKLEVYTRGRFIALTGYQARGRVDVNYGPQLLALMHRYGMPLERPVVTFEEGRDPKWSGPENDDELLDLALNQRPTNAQMFGNKPTFKELWEFDIDALARKVPAVTLRADGMPFDYSTVDASLMANLSYFTGRDEPRMVRLFERWKGYRQAHYEGKGSYRLSRVVQVGAGNPNVMSRDMRGPGERSLVPALKRPMCSDLLTLRNGNMIAALDLPPLQYLADEFMPMGCWLIVGPPKRGKTWMMLDLAVAVATGTEFLGFKCDQGRVLYLALEENDRRVQDRIVKLARQRGLNPRQALGQVLFGTISDDIPTADGGLYDMIAKILDDDPSIKLLIVDTLHKARPMQKNGENSYVYDRRCIDPFTDMLATRPGRSIVMIHHTKKSKTTDPYEMANGSMGLTGAADGHIFLLPDDQGQMVMHMQGRDCDQIEWAVKMTGCQWEVIGDPDSAGMSDTRAKILAAMRKFTLPVSPKEISEAAEIDANTVKQRLRGMCKDGFVMKQGYGKYVLTPKATTLGIAPTL